MDNTELYENNIGQAVEVAKGKLGRFMTIKEASEWLEVSERTIYKYLRANRFDSIKTRGRRLLYTGSIIAHQLKEKVIEINQLKDDELKKETLYRLRAERAKRYKER
jgi:excisionase family DNA binding protein